MAAPRKVFRIEETAAPQRAAQVDEAQAAGASPRSCTSWARLRAMLAAAPAARNQRQRRAARGRNRAPHFASCTSSTTALSGAATRTAEPNGTRLPAAPATRIANELEAVMKGSEQATQKILAAAEEIDQAANNLSAALKDETEQGLAQDIHDRVIQSSKPAISRI